MSLRFDTNSEGLKRTGNIPSNTSFTVCFWVYIVADLGNGVMQALITLNSATYTCWLYWNHSGSPGATLFGTFESTGGTFNVTGFAKPAAGQWIFYWMRCSGTGANLHEAGYALRGATSFTKAATTLIGNRSDPTYLVLGNNDDPGTQGSSARYRNLIAYTAAKSDDFLLRQMQGHLPVSTTDLAFWLPLMDRSPASNLIDFGGAKRDFTAMGTHTVEDGPPLPWAA